MKKLPNNQQEQAIYDRLNKLRENINLICEQCGRNPAEINILAATKTITPDLVNFSIENGISLLGENKAQELCSKYDSYLLKKDNIHFIGHLQTNKVKHIIDKVSMIESVDSFKLAQEIDRQAQKHSIIMPVLIEINIGEQESKSGVMPNQLEDLLKQASQLENIKIKGLMCIPPKENPKQYFEQMQKIYIDIKHKNMDNIDMSILSMGMSQDYEYAIPYGTNIIRIGSALYGARKYTEV